MIKKEGVLYEKYLTEEGCFTVFDSAQKTGFIVWLNTVRNRQ